ncbi:MAG: ABC transporter substrate-binding protein [Actinomycetota bacterium]
MSALAAVTILVFTACSKASSTASGPTATTAGETAAACAKSATFLTSGTITIGTSNPAYSPFFQGGTTSGSDWKLNDPTTGKGFEDAIAYEVAKRLGFSPGQVTWVPVKFDQSYAPGPLPFDLNIQQVSYKPVRAQAVDFSTGYYISNQALVAVKGSPITNAASIADLKQYKLGAPIGTTSYDFIANVIQPNGGPASYQSESDAVAAINGGQVDGLIVDLPTALYMADPYVQQVKNSVVAGQFTNPPGGTPPYWGMTLTKGSSLTPCVDLALAEMRRDGALQTITKTWLSDKTNVGTVPLIGP